MERNKLINKGIAFAVILLFIGLAFAPSINANMSEVQEYQYEDYELEIELVFNVDSIDMIIKNTGDEYCSILRWSIRLAGGLILLPFPLGYTQGDIDVLPPGQRVTVGSGRIFGLGRTTIRGWVRCWDGLSIREEQEAFIFLFFIRPV